MTTRCCQILFVLVALTGCARKLPPPIIESGKNFEGWTNVALANIPYNGELRANGTYLLRTGKWVSPKFEIESQAWYRMTFDTKSPVAAYSTARFYDGNGREMGSDNYSGIDASGGWIFNDLFFMGRPLSHHATVAVEVQDGELQVRKIAVGPVSALNVLSWMDDLYAELPPVDYVPPRDRWQHLPRTRHALKTGGELRVLVLGDSIANDFCNSHFQLLIERNNPGVTAHLTPSVRSSTSCCYYRHENRVQDYVIQHAPDLVIILNLGVDRVAAVLDVVSQVRASIDCEVLVMSGAVSLPDTAILRSGRKRWRKLLAESVELRARTIRVAEQYCRQMQSHASEHRLAVFDLRGVWEDYLASCGKPNDWFLRDPLHANERGKQVLARIAEIYFSDGET